RVRRRLRRVRDRTRGPADSKAGRPQLRAGRGRPHLWVRRPPRPARRGGDQGGAESLDHRGARGGGVVRGPAGKGVGAKVTGVASTAQLELVGSIGADEVI